MSYQRIKAIVIRNLYLYQRSLPRLMDVVFWPTLDLALWGFLSFYLQRFNLPGVNIVTLLLGAVIFWEFFIHSQRAVSIAFLEEVWERNFLNIFVSPLSLSELLMSMMVIGFVRLILIATVMSILATVFYSFNIFSLGFVLIPFVINLLLFGWSLGVFITAIILRYGTSAQVLAFGMIAIIQPFTAVFYPVSALPISVQWISSLIPTTYVFEGMRAVFSNGAVPTGDLILAFVLNIIYLIITLWFFRAMFKRVKKMGRLLKLD